MASYNPQEDPTAQLALQELCDHVAGLFPAIVYLSGRGSFVKFKWADWPEALSLSQKERVESFFGRHPGLRPIDKGSEDWRTVFPGQSDDEAAAEIGKRLETHFPSRVGWVLAERDNRGRIVANSFIDGIGETLWHLSWRHVSADPSVLKLNVPDVQSFNAAILDVSDWASSRIQPILGALRDRLQALYGDRFQGLFVFGSYARPDAGIRLSEDSDLDVALILSDFTNAYEEIKRFGDITYDLSLEHSIVISLVPIREADYREGRTNFARGISSYAIPV